MQIRGRVWSEDREDWKKERERERLEKGEKTDDDRMRVRFRDVYFCFDSR